jgi:hypothetical protein
MQEAEIPAIEMSDTSALRSNRTFDTSVEGLPSWL